MKNYRQLQLAEQQVEFDEYKVRVNRFSEGIFNSNFI